MKDRICKALGENIKKYRKLGGYTQETLAEAMGMEIKSLSLIETGKGFISANTLAKLSEILHVTPSELFEISDLSENEKLYNEAQKCLEIIKNDNAKLKAVCYILKGII